MTRNKFIAAGLCLLFLVLESGQSAYAVLSVTDWEQRFLSAWQSEFNTYDPMSKSNDSSQYYNLAYPIDGNVAMFEAMGKPEYLDRAIYYVNNVIASARLSATIPTSQYKDNYLAWVSLLNQPGVYLVEVPLYESYLWRYVTKLLRVIRQTPTLYSNNTYKNFYDSALAFTERNIFDKWYSRGLTNIYRSRTHMASHWAYIALDLWLITADTSRKPRYQEVFTKINSDLQPFYQSSLREQLRPHPLNPQAYFWSDVWGSYAAPGQDVSHGNGMISYIVEAKDQGMYWNEIDIQAFSTLLKRIIIKPAGGFANYVDGSGAGTGWFNDGFVKLGRYDWEIQAFLETHNVGRNTQLYGNGALNAKQLTTIGDVNHDGIVNTIDAKLILNEWLGISSCQSFVCDIAEDNKINAYDFAWISKQWSL